MNYLLDTNVFHNVGLKNILENFENCGFIVPSFVLEELENQKIQDGERGYKARLAIRELYEIKKYGNLNEWIKLENNVSIKVEHHFDDKLHLQYNKMDDLIIGCLSLCNSVYGETIIITDDIVMALKAEGFGFKTLQINTKKDLYKTVYKGYEEFEVEDKIIDYFYERGYLYNSELPMIPYDNQFLILKSNINEKKKAIGIYCYDKLEKSAYFDTKPSGLTPRNLEQKMAIELLMRDDIPMVSFTGTYGSSKTILQLSCALEKIENGSYKKILLIKPPMPLDRNLMVGFKKGDLFEKYINTLGSITSNLEALKYDKKDRMMNGVKLLEGYITQNIIEIISIEDILGSSYNNAIILAEEMQLLTKENMEALLSRVGNSRIFINGDLKQSSRLINKDPREMGLYHMIDVFKDSKLSGHLTLQSIQRSEFVKELSERW